jgi:LuxR family transcriptional regulator of csgAB operon
MLGAWKAGAHGSPGAASGLTARESDVLLRIAAGARNEEIATQLSISVHTVKTHVYRIFQKIGVETRLQAARWSERNR